MSSDITVRQATVADTEIVAEYNRRLALETENLALDTNVLLARFDSHASSSYRNVSRSSICHPSGQ